MEKKIGIIKSISKKEGGRNAFTLVDEKTSEGKDQWFNGFTLEAEKGDKIEFELEINDTWHNFSKVKVTEKAPKVQSAGSAEFRVNVDAGNCVQRAVELINGGKKESLMAITLLVVSAFRAAKNELEKEINQYALEQISPDKSEEVSGAI